MGWKTKTTSGGGDFEACPAGNHTAILIGLIDIGTQKESYAGELKEMRKVFLMWEVPGEQKTDGGNFVMGREYTFSLNEKAALRKLIEAWRSKKLDEGEDFDLSKLIGQACMLTVMNEEKNEKTFANVGGVSALPKKTAKPVATRETILFNFEDDDIDDFPTQDWIPWSYGKQLITKAQLSPEWHEQMAKKRGDGGASSQSNPTKKPPSTPAAKKETVPPNDDADEVPF